MEKIENNDIPGKDEERKKQPSCRDLWDHDKLSGEVKSRMMELNPSMSEKTGMSEGRQDG